MSTLDRVKFYAASSGTGSFVVSSVFAGFITPATAGMADGTPLSYVAQNPSNSAEWEYGHSSYTVSGTLIARSSIRSSSGLGVTCSFSSAPVVAITPLAEDVPNPNVIDVFKYGIDSGLGVINGNATNDTPIIDAAFAASQTQGKPVFFSWQHAYAYNGSGWSATYAGSPCWIIGDQGGGNASNTNIAISAGKYLVDNNTSDGGGGLLSCGPVLIHGISTSGGAGIFRDRCLNTDTVANKTIRDNFFYNYTAAAISANSIDSPNWYVVNNTFYGANTTTCMGLAIAGLGGGNDISNNKFLNNAVHIKLCEGGNNTCIGGGNYFLSFSAGTGRVMIWIVPQVGYTNSGEGFVVRDVKFGNENLDASDYCIIYADEGSGTYVGDRLPSFSASTGVIQGHQVDCVTFAGISSSSSTRSLVYSTTPNVIGCGYTSLHLEAPPRYILEFASPPVNSNLSGHNIIGPIYVDTGLIDNTTYVAFAPTNGINTCVMYDPSNAMDLTNLNVPCSLPATADSGDFKNLVTASIAAPWNSGGSVAISTTTDTCGGSDAVSLNFTGYGLVYNSNAAVVSVLELPIWMEFDIGPDTGPINAVHVWMADQDNGNASIWSAQIAVPTATRRVRFRIDPATVPTLPFFFVIDNTTTGVGASPTGKVKIGRVAIYQARQPVSGNISYGAQYIKNVFSGGAPGTPSGGAYVYSNGGFPSVVSSSGIVGRLLVGNQGAPAAKTTSTTLTAAEVTNGIITVNQGGAAASNLQLCTGSAMDAALPDAVSAVSNSSFDFSLINISTVVAEVANITTNTGWTLVGDIQVQANSAVTAISSGHFRVRRTGGGAGSGTYTLYRIG